MFAVLLTRRNRSALLAFVFCLFIGAWLFLGKVLSSPSRSGSWEDPPDPVLLDTIPPHALSTSTPCPICAPAPAPTCPEPPKPAETPRARPRLSDVLFFPQDAPESGIQLNEPWLAENTARLRALFRCLEDDTCKKNQASVVILESYFITGSYMDWTGGESIWGRSVIKALSDLGYTYLFAPTLSHTLHLYQTLPTLTAAIITDPWSITVCASKPGEPDPANPLTQGFARTGHFADGCVRTPQSPAGIPLWKMLGFYFWPFPGHPLGMPWTLSPEPWGARTLGAGNAYVGYSVETQCGVVPFVPHAARDGEDGKAQAWVMAKRLGYFVPGRSAWPNAVYDAASAAADVRFALGADQGGIENGGAGAEMTEEDLPRGIKNYGVLEQEAFMRQLAKSRVLIGIGNPLLSPSPYDALCLGVPFINPIHGWKADEPLNKAHWDTQHDILAQLDPPYVYNVHQGDEKAFVKAIQDAIRTPIDRYILPRMHQDEITKRVDAILKTDLKGEAEKLLERRRSGVEKGDLFMI
ncbi:hypothetical protein FIBSPDRAFT_1041421 [Athelia psychrophila]|uniref:alpha-1,6-mannosyl-glycoprotein 6-beta-N-acetylglucosaminyltransferase n=1 Tax=Athelia psychrophila TaxID=1759441 RepID=A0A166P163_9AGAM|nr:hypothetical protein FIBSPDRAFT_1041421 [Fibularhizoctonia sp. CBS 109695]